MAAKSFHQKQAFWFRMVLDPIFLEFQILGTKNPPSLPLIYAHKPGLKSDHLAPKRAKQVSIFKVFVFKHCKSH